MFALLSRTDRPLIVGFGERSRVRVRRGGDSSFRAVVAPVPDVPEMWIWQTLLDASSLFVDVGANVGLYSLIAAERGARVVAFEPAADMVARLRENIRIAGAVGIDVRDAVVWETAGLTVGLKGVDANRRHVGEGTDHVTTTLDLELRGESPMGIKIDVEGAERRVLLGSSATLAQAELVLIQLEWNAADANFGEDRADLARLLEGAGFVLFRPSLDGTSEEFAPGSTPPIGSDVFAARRWAADLLRAGVASKAWPRR